MVMVEYPYDAFSPSRRLEIKGSLHPIGTFEFDLLVIFNLQVLDDRIDSI
jgi:hypothetical protein